MTSPNTVLAGSYDFILVALSVIIAVLASYAALDLAGRVTSARGRARLLWLSGGAIAMGLGIWSMHYIGMLALSLPVPVLYDLPTVVLSLVAAFFSSAIALWLVSRPTLRAGPVADLIGAKTYLWISAGWVVVTTVALMLVRDVREYRTREPAAEAAAVSVT